MNTKKVVILISGTGSNMQAIINANIPNCEIAAIISNKADAPGLIWAKAQGYKTHFINHQKFATREDFDRELVNQIDVHAPDLVVLAGFMRILTSVFCNPYKTRLINIHPSLLPAFTGLHTHQRALDAGCKIAGCTVHFVTSDLDCGPIIAQAVVPIANNDTADSLAKKVLACEHIIYPQAVKDFLSGKLIIENNRVINSSASIELDNLIVQ